MFPMAVLVIAKHVDTLNVLFVLNALLRPCCCLDAKAQEQIGSSDQAIFVEKGILRRDSKRFEHAEVAKWKRSFLPRARCI